MPILARYPTMDALGAKGYILAKLKTELPPARTYHSLEHTLDVYASVIGIAEQEGITGEGFMLLKTAALYHDAGFTVQETEHEEAGCRIVREVLPGYGYAANQIELICDMILATRIPQQPTSELARALCDADLDYLGRADFWIIGDTLYKEMRHFGVLGSELEWNELQLRFLERHRYFTATNNALREHVKQDNLAQVKAWLEKNR